MRNFSRNSGWFYCMQAAKQAKSIFGETPWGTHHILLFRCRTLWRYTEALQAGITPIFAQIRYSYTEICRRGEIDPQKRITLRVGCCFRCSCASHEGGFLGQLIESLLSDVNTMLELEDNLARAALLRTMKLSLDPPGGSRSRSRTVWRGKTKQRAVCNIACHMRFYKQESHT